MKTFYTLLVAVLLVGCASTGANYRPIVDTQGINAAQYEDDLRACQQYAAQASGAGEQAAAGAVAGAVLGALFGGLAGGSHTARNRTSAVGAASGALGGAARGETEQRAIITRCLGLRGYRVLQ